MINHYKWLGKHFPEFVGDIGLDFNHFPGIISAHGDKGSTYQSVWEEAQIPYEHGMAIYLLTYVFPFGRESREQPDGTWVDPCKWVIDNYYRFKEHLTDEDLGKDNMEW